MKLTRNVCDLLFLFENCFGHVNKLQHVFMSRTRLVRFYLVVYYQDAAASNLKKQTCLPVTLLKPEATACVLLLYK